MKHKSAIERTISIKIGLIFLVVILYFCGVFIYSFNLKRDIDARKQDVERSYQILARTNRLISSLQQAQGITNAYLESPRRIYRQQYDSISSDIFTQIAEMKAALPGENREELLDNIHSLLDERNALVHRLSRQFRTGNPLQEIDRKLDAAYNKPEENTVVVLTDTDSTVVVHEKKKFWTRLRGLFSPQHAADTTIYITETEKDMSVRTGVDTAAYSDLKTVTQEVATTYSVKMQNIEHQVKSIVVAEQNISSQISLLLSRLHLEALQIYRGGVGKSEELTRTVFLFSVTSGAFSLLLILLIILLIINDLKKGEQARSDLVNEKQRTENLMESRHKLLLSVSHDIKTPLSSMMGYIDLWALDKPSEIRKRQIRSARNSGNHILNMLSNLLEFSRLEQNSGKLNLSCFNLIELSEETMEMFRPLTAEKDIHIAFHNHAPAPCFVETDYTVLKQILINVLSNAIKYTPSGSISLELDAAAAEVSFKISDTGVGIGSEDIDDVFKPFSRMENALKAEGSGFGMYVTKGLVDSLGGHIGIQSEKNVGTTVTIRFPLTRLEGVYSAEQQTILSADGQLCRNLLIIEDHAALGNMMREYLEQQGYVVTLCATVNEIRVQLENLSAFDIVFTDMELLHVTGKDVLRAIRKRGSQIPVWLMTAHGDYNLSRALADGFGGFVTKPVSMEKLVRLLSGGENGEKVEKQSSSPLSARFPLLASLFDGDDEAMREILEKFVETSREDSRKLMEQIRRGNFTEAAKLCHKIHPLLSQLGANHLCSALLRMDTLRGETEAAYPAWKEELTQTVESLDSFAGEIEKKWL